MPIHCQFLPGRPHHRLLDKPATRQWRRQCPSVCPSPASVHPTRPPHSPVHCQFLPGRSHRRLLDKPVTRQWRRRVHGHPLASVHPQRLCISHSPCHSPIRARPCPSVHSACPSLCPPPLPPPSVVPHLCHCCHSQRPALCPVLATTASSHP